MIDASQEHVNGEDEDAYDQKDAEGFIRLNALRMRIAARQKHRNRSKQ